MQILYDLCIQINCPKFKKEKEKLLCETASIFDQAEDLKCFVNSCAKYCPHQLQNNDK